MYSIFHKTSRYLIPAIILQLCFAGTVAAQRLDRFGSVASGIYRNGRQAAIAFPQFIRYFSYSSFEKAKSAESKGDSALTCYFYLSEDVSELGIRVISPVPSMAFPGKDDEVSENYFSKEKDKGRFFNPQLWLYKAETDSISSTATAWNLLSYNDNSRELPAQPDGKNNNALIRLYNKKDPASKEVHAGLYKLVLMPSDTLSFEGSFVLEAGCLSDLPVLTWRK